MAARRTYRCRRTITAACVALTLVLVAGACEDPNFVESQIRISVRNDTAGTVYWVKAPAAAGTEATVRGPHQPIPPSTTSVVGAGGVEVDPGAGGCFRDEQLWLVASRSDARFDVDTPTSADDVVVLKHWDGDNCFDTSEVDVTLP